MAFDFNLNIEKTEDQFSIEALIENGVKDYDALYNAYDMFDGPADFKNAVLKYIADSNFDEYIQRIGNECYSYFDLFESGNSSSDVTAQYTLPWGKFDDIIKAGKYKNDVKFLAFLSLFVDEFEIFNLEVNGSYEVEFESPDPEVGYYGGSYISDYETNYVAVNDDSEPADKPFLFYDIVYARVSKVWNNGKWVTKTDKSKCKNIAIGNAFSDWVECLTNGIEIDLSDYDYEPDYEPDDY